MEEGGGRVADAAGSWTGMQIFTTGGRVFTANIINIIDY